MVAEEEGHEAAHIESVGRQRRGAGEKVNAGCGHRVQVIRHAFGEGEHHGQTADERGVYKVAAETAEEHLDDDHGDKVADEELPDRHRHGDVVGNEHAGNDRGEIGDGLLLFKELVPHKLEQHAVCCGDRHEQQRAEPEDNNGCDERRDERDEHIAHDAPRRCALLMIVGRDAYDKTVVHFPASFRVFMRLS